MQKAFGAEPLLGKDVELKTPASVSSGEWMADFRELPAERFLEKYLR